MICLEIRDKYRSMRPIIELLIDDFQERDLPRVVPRDRSVSVMPGKATVVVGMRRSGKTWFCYQRMHELLAGDLGKERLVYINFEDERLQPFHTADLQDILYAYYRKYPALKSQRCHLFLDEVHTVPDWDRFVRRVLDTENIEVWVTGSSSKLLSTEIATSLRGRSLATEIFPFSFREFLRYHECLPDSLTRLGSRQRAELQHLVERYLLVGGFPEVQPVEEEMRRRVHRDYLDVVILRDVAERHRVSNIAALRALIRHILASPAARFSVTRFYANLKQQGIACSKNDLYLFLEYLQDAFLVYLVPIYSRSEKARQVNPKKAYVVDTGLIHAASFQMTGDRGALLENLVFLHLRRQGVAPAYCVTSTGKEVDFVFSRGGEIELIQTCWTLSQHGTRAREESALLGAMQELGVKRAKIITWLDEGGAAAGIEVIPAWRWLLAE